MPNKKIELVKKWLAYPESVSKGELVASAHEAMAAYCAAYRSSYRAAAADAAYCAANKSVDGNAAAAEFWVKKYEELIK